MGQIRNVIQTLHNTHDAIKAFNKSKSYIKKDSLPNKANKSFLRFSLILQGFHVTWWATPFLAIMFGISSERAFIEELTIPQEKVTT